MNAHGEGALRMSLLRRARHLGLAVVALVPLSLGPTAGAYGKATGYLGVSLQSLTPTLRAGMGVKQRGGVLVADVVDKGPGDLAGLQEGDIVLTAGGTRVTAPGELQAIVREGAPGTRLQLHILRDGAEQDVAATLGERPASGIAPQAMRHEVMRDRADGPSPRMQMFREGDAQDAPGGFLGVQLADLTPQLRAYFGVGDDEGVLVTEVGKDSPAAAAGFRAGDVIVKIDDATVTSQGEARGTIRQQKPGADVSFTVVRDKMSQSISATLGEAPASEVALGEMPGMPGMPNLGGLPHMMFRDSKGKRGAESIGPGDGPQIFKWKSDETEGDGGDTYFFDSRDNDADAPEVRRSTDGESRRIIIREKRSKDDGDDRGDVWSDDGGDRDGDVRVMIKKRRGDSRDIHDTDRALRREIRELRREIDQLRDELGDEDRDR